MTYPLRAFCCGALLASAAIVLAACDHSPAPPATAVQTTAADAGAGSARFVALAPSAAEQQRMHLQYNTFAPAADGNRVDFIPLPPKAGNVVLGINHAGAYALQLTDPKCAFDVNVVPSEGEAFVLNAVWPSRRVVLSKPGRITAAMGASATDNYFCNVRLRPL